MISMISGKPNLCDSDSYRVTVKYKLQREKVAFFMPHPRHDEPFFSTAHKATWLLDYSQSREGIYF